MDFNNYDVFSYNGVTFETNFKDKYVFNSGKFIVRYWAKDIKMETHYTDIDPKEDREAFIEEIKETYGPKNKIIKLL